MRYLLDEVTEINIQRFYDDVYECPEGNLMFNVTDKEEVQFFIEYLDNAIENELEAIEEAERTGALRVRTAVLTRHYPDYVIEYLDKNSNVLIKLKGDEAKHNKRVILVTLPDFDLRSVLQKNDICVSALVEIMSADGFQFPEIDVGRKYKW